MLHNFQGFADEPLDCPDLGPMFKFVSPALAKAAQDSSRYLSRMGVRHALVGGLAVGAYGVRRTTDDVDFLVDESAFEDVGGNLLVFRAGLPFRVGDIGIDFVPAQDVPFLRTAIQDAWDSEDIPVVSIEALIFLKLKAWRPQDRDDLTRFVQLGVDLQRVEAYLGENAPYLLQRWKQIIARAEG